MSIIVMGAGYVGLPLAISFSKHFPVICYDIDKVRIKDLQKGIDSNKQHSTKEIKKNNLIFTNDVSLLKNNLFYIITVPTPIKSNNIPDISMLKQVSILVGKLIKKGSYIIYESTTYPGCTEDFCIPIIEQKSRMLFEKDFFVGYSPERVNPGDKINTLNNITKIVGANDYKTLKKIQKLYKVICKSIYPVKSIKIAESAKVIENTQRDINIAFVNELSVIFNKLNIPTNEVLKAAATKWNFHYYKPGLVGGHCISVDPYYLAYKVKQHNYTPKLILSGREYNENISKFIALQIKKLILENDLFPNKISVGILGFAFKENIPDVRNTKIYSLIQELKNLSIKNLKVFDGVVSKKYVKKIYRINVFNFQDLKKFKFDALVLAVSHKEFLKKINFYNKFYKNPNKKIFIDIKNNYESEQLKKSGFKYFQL